MKYIYEFDGEIKRCDECPLCFLNVDFDYDTEEYTCLPKGEQILYITHYDNYEEELKKLFKSDDCPLKEVR